MSLTPDIPSLDVQSSVAKILSRENITVKHGQYTTAWFDPKTRVLGLPRLKSSTKAINDLFIGHEVGHSLFTPTDLIEEWKTRLPDVPFAVCNILEDVRIEKRIRREYPGLISLFREGYKDLWDSNFFDQDEFTVQSLNFLDRLNMKAKIPDLDIFFTREEKKMLEKVLDIETVEDLFRLAEELKEFSSKKEEPESKENDSEQEEEGEPDQNNPEGNSSDGDNPEEENPNSEGSDEPTDSDEDEIGDNDNGVDPADGNSEDISEDESEDEPTQDSSDSGGYKPSDLESETEKAIEQNIVNDIDRSNAWEQFVAPTKEMIDSAVYSYETVIGARNSETSIYNQLLYDFGEQNLRNKFQEFQANSKPVISHLRQEFERKKAAFQNSRASESTKGVINVDRLHEYRFNDEIFKTVTNLPNAKSHGMVFLVDYSASMAYSLRGTILKILNLCDFCNSMGIPFEVYSFTSTDVSVLASQEENSPNNFENMVDGMINIHSLHINQLLSSSMSRSTMKEAMFQLFVASLNHGELSAYENLGGTPLLEALTVMPYLIKKFQKKNPHQVTNFMLLSDGDGHSIRFKTVVSRNRFGTIYGKNIVKFVPGIWSYNKNFKNLIDNISKVCNANTICFYLSDSSDLSERIRKLNSLYSQENGKRIDIKKNRNTKIYSYNNVLGFDKYILMDNRIENSSTSFKDSYIDTSSTAKIQREFNNFNRTKKDSRVFAQQLVETISSNF